MPNTQTSVPAFTAGQVLTAAQMTEVNTGIPVFATTTTRDAAFGGTGEKTLAEGQFAYIEASDTTQYYNGTSWLALGGKIAQVVSTTKTDTFTTTSSTFVDLTGLSVSITPSATSSKVLVFYTIVGQGVYGSSQAYLRLLRDSTAIGSGAAAGSRITVSSFLPESYSGLTIGQAANLNLDSPASTSALTYKIQIASSASGATVYVNRNATDTDSAFFGRSSSSIVALEVLA
jgi:hypothetical protein